jgi:NADPH:quinone reductase-like Zn-dependent oxidoreductase
VKAVRFHQYGGPEVLRLEEVPTPSPEAGEALIRVGACGVNHIDLDLRAGTSGFPLSLPHILGIEVTGEIVALGPGVTARAVGERVAVPFGVSCGECRECQSGRDNLCLLRIGAGYTRPGGYAEYLPFPAAVLRPLPASLSFTDAAATLVAFSTAWHMLVNRARLQVGETVLVQAAGSGVGSAAIQVASFAGVRVIATGSTDGKLEAARKLGADETVNYAREDFVTRVLDLTGGRGVEVVVEHVGGEVFTHSLKCLAPNGRLVTCGAHAGETPQINIIELIRKELQVIGSRRATRLEMDAVMNLVARGTFRPVIDKVLPLGEAAEAHRRLAERRHFGKLVLMP